MDYVLGYDTRRKKNGAWATSTKTSAHKAIANTEQSMGHAPLAKSPAAVHDHPEEDSSAPLIPLCMCHY